MRTILFPIILLILVLLIELYTYKGLKSRWSEFSVWLRITTKTLFFTFGILSLFSFVALFVFGRDMPNAMRNLWFGFSVINLIIKFVFSLFLLADDIRRLGIWVYKKVKSKKTTQDSSTENGISRADFILKAGLISAAVPAISLPLGMIIGPYKYTLHQPTVHLPHLPKPFNGLKIVQISDIHAGSFYDKEAVNRGIDLLLLQKPDVIFFTGDLVNDSAHEMDDYMDVFSRLKAPLGVFSILGNHDYGDYYPWESEEARNQNLVRLKEIHAELGWKLLLNEHVYLEKQGEKIGLIGVENWGAGFHQEGRLDLAYKDCDAPVKFLLSHDPTHWDEQVRKHYQDIDITFSGHTHGMQMGIETAGFKWSPASLRYDKWAGLYQTKNQYLYVNRGYGFLGYPGRIGIWPEITVMTLHSNHVS